MKGIIGIFNLNVVDANFFSIIFELNLLMELKVFVTETIKEIIEGVIEAQKLIVPQVNHANEGFVQIGNGSFSQIEFDISVTSSEAEGNENKAGIFIKVLDIGHKNTATSNNTSVNKIKFSVPVTFPTQANKKFI